MLNVSLSTYRHDKVKINILRKAEKFNVAMLIANLPQDSVTDPPRKLKQLLTLSGSVTKMQINKYT